MLTDFKKYIGLNLIGHKLRFKCDCLVPFDTVGTIRDFEVRSNELIFKVEMPNGKLIDISENHPKLKVEPA